MKRKYIGNKKNIKSFPCVLKLLFIWNRTFFDFPCYICNMTDTRVIELYTDGAAKGNPGRGGYGVVLKFGSHIKEFSAGFRLTTNNRMELLALIVGLESIKDSSIPVKVFSDSKYVIDSISKGWIFGWRSKGFKGKKNADLWMRYMDLHPRFQLTFTWVKGHAGHFYNERCDQLAVAAAEQKNLPADENYEALQSMNGDSALF